MRKEPAIDARSEKTRQGGSEFSMKGAFGQVKAKSAPSKTRAGDDLNRSANSSYVSDKHIVTEQLRELVSCRSAE